MSPPGRPKGEYRRAQPEGAPVSPARSPTGHTPPAGQEQPARSGTVVALAPARILQALAGRSRYRYVQPRIEPEGAGWKVFSPNCSRSIHPDGGEIPIAWIEPAGRGRWALHSFDHGRSTWCLEATALSLGEALGRVCGDVLGRFWP
jgi:hypothetical protein